VSLLSGALCGIFQELVKVPGPSGFEKKIREKILEITKPYCDEQIVDPLGNVICLVRGRNEEKRILLTAHMDTIGLIVTRITNEGFIKFARIGGVNPQTLIGTPVKIIGKKEVEGIISYKPYHLLKTDEKQKIPDIRNLYIDCGVSSKDELKGIVSVGDPITFCTSLRKLGKHRISSAGLDNRTGCVILIELLKRLRDKEMPCNIYFSFTVQEEIGVMAAQSVAFRVKPNLAIILDTTHATDIPPLSGYHDIKLGFGPAIASPPSTKEDVFNFLIKVAHDEKIPYQIEPELAPRGTEAGVVQLVRSGIRTALVSIPLRYMHSTNEIIDLRDVENAIDLLTHVLLRKEILQF